MGCWWLVTGAQAFQASPAVHLDADPPDRHSGMWPWDTPPYSPCVVLTWWWRGQGHSRGQSHLRGQGGSGVDILIHKDRHGAWGLTWLLHTQVTL